MKAVIVKINDNKAIALQGNGALASIKNNGYYIGQELYIKNTGGSLMKRTQKILIAAASLIVLLIIGGGLVYAGLTPQTYISLDINPSIELDINVFDRVIDARALNEDGESVLAGLDLKGKRVEEAIELIVLKIESGGYINPETTNTIYLGVYSDSQSKADAILETSIITVSATLGDRSSEVSVSAGLVDDETLQNAIDNGTTAGKQELIEILEHILDDYDFDDDELETMTVAELLRAISENADQDDIDTITGATLVTDDDFDDDDVDTVSGASLDDYDDDDDDYDDDDYDDDDYDDDDYDDDDYDDDDYDDDDYDDDDYDDDDYDDDDYDDDDEEDDEDEEDEEDEEDDN